MQCLIHQNWSNEYSPSSSTPQRPIAALIDSSGISDTMPPRKKGAAAAKKEKKAKPESTSASASAAPSSTTTTTRRSTRAKKAAGPEPEIALDAAIKDEEQEAALEDASASKASSSRIKKEDPEPAGQDVKVDPEDAVQPSAASDLLNEVHSKVISSAVEAQVESSFASSAAEGIAPDIIGVIEEREDEDLAIDDTEPAPMDDEERRRIQERPAEATNTSDAPVPLPESNGFEKVTQAAGMPAKEAIANYSATPFGELQSTNDSSSAGPSVSREERMNKMNALRKKMVG